MTFTRRHALALLDASVAQRMSRKRPQTADTSLVERQPTKLRVVSSNLTRGTITLFYTASSSSELPKALSSGRSQRIGFGHPLSF
jgi:hypothetical protein